MGMVLTKIKAKELWPLKAWSRGRRPMAKPAPGLGQWIFIPLFVDLLVIELNPLLGL